MIKPIPNILFESYLLTSKYWSARNLPMGLKKEELVQQSLHKLIDIQFYWFSFSRRIGILEKWDQDPETTQGSGP